MTLFLRNERRQSSSSASTFQLKRTIMKYLIKIAGLLLLVALFETGCKKDEVICTDPTNVECSNYDPCYGQTALTADFTIEENIGGIPAGPFDNSEYDPYLSLTDTVLRGRSVLFTALGDADRYEWTIGTDTTRYTGKTVSLRFFSFDNSLFAPRSIEVRLRAIRDTPQSCFPGDNVKESVRTLTVVNAWSTKIASATFRGVSTQAPDSPFVASVKNYEYGTHDVFTLYNFPAGCLTDTTGGGREETPYVWGYRSAVFYNGGADWLTGYSGPCYAMSGMLDIDEEGKVFFRYYLQMANSINGPYDEIGEFHTFEGRLIN